MTSVHDDSHVSFLSYALTYAVCFTRLALQRVLLALVVRVVVLGLVRVGRKFTDVAVGVS